MSIYDARNINVFLAALTPQNLAARSSKPDVGFLEIGVPSSRSMKGERPLAAGRGDAVLFADSLEERKDDDQEAKRHCVSLDGDAFLDDGHNGKRREENVAAVKTGTSSAHDARGESVAEGHKPVSPTLLAGGRGDATPTPDKAYDGVEAVDSVPSAEPVAAAERSNQSG